MRTLFSKHNSQKGQSLTEMAISMVILLILVAGIFDVGRAIFTYMSMRDAAQEGASYAAIIFMSEKDNETRTETQLRNDGCAAVLARTMENVEDPNTAVEILINGISCGSASIQHDACAGHEARVTVELPIPVTTPFIGAFIGSQTITLRATATDTILRPYCK